MILILSPLFCQKRGSTDYSKGKKTDISHCYQVQEPCHLPQQTVGPVTWHPGIQHPQVNEVVSPILKKRSQSLSSGCLKVNSIDQEKNKQLMLQMSVPEPSMFKFCAFVTPVKELSLGVLLRYMSEQ